MCKASRPSDATVLPNELVGQFLPRATEDELTKKSKEEQGEKIITGIKNMPSVRMPTFHLSVGDWLL